MKRIASLLILLLTSAVAFGGAPVKELPPKAQSYIERVQTQSQVKKNSYEVKSIQDNKEFSYAFASIRGTKGNTMVTYDDKKPEEGVQVWFNVTWYKFIDNDGMPTGEEIQSQFAIGENPGAIAYGAACALHRGCPLTIGLKPDRFEDTGLFLSLKLTHEELLQICSKY